MRDSTFVAILVGLIVLLMITVSLAFADYIEYSGLRIESERPGVCIFQAEDDPKQFDERNILNHTVTAVNRWTELLENYTNNDGWGFTYYYIEKDSHVNKTANDFMYCDVLITFVKQNMEDGALGRAGFDYSWSQHKYTFLTIYMEQTPNSMVLKPVNIVDGDTQTIYFNFEKEPVPIDKLQRIVAHEFGHALGLLHHTPTLFNNFESIMRTSFDFDELPEITDTDLAAIVNLYGEDGFKEHNNLLIPKCYPQFYNIRVC